ncbi:MAG TPA: alpha/beta hydrolase [Pseudonocardiaceae bacterium]
MITETDIGLADGRALHVYDSGPADADLTVYWHAGTPQIGLPPTCAVDRPGVRWIAHDRPGYGGSTACPGRDVASVAADVALVADVLGVARFAVLGSSGGGPHALACAALLPYRVLGVACLASLAPYDAHGLDWFAGMAPSGAAELRASVDGPDALREFLTASGDQPPDWFTSNDIALFSGPFGPWLNTTGGQGTAKGLDGFVDDDVAYVSPWGFDPARIDAPVLLLHGDKDRCVPHSHSGWLARRCPTSELRLCPDDSHISVLRHMDIALDWLGKLG